MFKNLREIADSTVLRLTDIQKAVLLTIFVAETPLIAADSSTGSEYAVQSRQFLVQTGLARMSNKGIVATPEGYEALISNGLVDEMDNVTESGKTLLQWFDSHRQELIESKIPFRYIRSIVSSQGGT